MRSGEPRLKRPTIKDVAAHADVSISTVSLVINDKGYVSPETRDRVRQSVLELNFVPRPSARALPSQQTGNVGFVVRDDHFRRTEPFYTGVYLGSEFEANNKNLYVLLSTVSQAYRAGVDTPRFLRERNVDGILVAGKVPLAFIEEASNSNLPIVLIDYEHQTLPAAIIDNVGGAQSAVQHLIEKGHRKIAFLGADMSHPSLSARREGFQLACVQAGIPEHEIRFAVTDEGSADYETGLVLAQDLLASDNRPSAVFCVNDSTAMSVLDQATRLGLHVPGDLAIIGFDDVPQARHTQPGLTTVRVRTEQLGEIAMRYLVDLVHDQRASRDQRGAHRIIVPTELVIRDTT